MSRALILLAAGLSLVLLAQAAQAGPRGGSCLTFAWRRYRTRGGYVFARVSNWGPFPHFLWSPTAPPECESFVPDSPTRRLFPPLVFRGHVKRGDERS